MRHWVKVCCVYDVCRRTDAGSLDYACRYTLERCCLALVLSAVCVAAKERGR